MRGNDAELSFPILLIRCAIFLGVFCILSAIFILILSAVFYNTANPTAQIPIASLLSLYLSVFIASFIFTKINGEKWLVGGLLLGIFIYLLTLMLAFLVKTEGNTYNIILRVLIPFISLLSAFLARRRDKKIKKFKKHKIK